MASGADNVVTIVGGIAFSGVCPVSAATIFLGNGNVVKKDVSFFEVYGQLTHTINDNWAFDLKEYYTPDFLNSGAWGDYVSVTAKHAAPSTIFGSSGVGLYVSGEFGRQFLGRTDAFYGVAGVPLRHQVGRQQHLEHRCRFQLQGRNARPALLRHQSIEGQLQRFYQRLQCDRNEQREADQSERRRLQLVRRAGIAKLSFDLRRQIT